jgi:hypothetical protein
MEDREELRRIYAKLASSWLELGQEITCHTKRGEYVEKLLKVKLKLNEAMDILLFDE